MSAVYEGMKFQIPFEYDADELIESTMSGYQVELAETDFADSKVTENKDGSYTISLVLSGEALSGIIAQLESSMASSIGIDIGDAAMSIGDVSYEMTYDKDYFLTNLELDMTMSMEYQGETIEITMTMSSTMAPLAADYKVSPPADADTYIDGSSFGLTADTFTSIA